MSEPIEIRVTRIEEHVKQNVKDVAEIKNLIKTHTEAEMKSMKELNTHIVQLEANTTAVKFGWKVLVTVGTASLAIIGLVLKFAGVISWPS